MSVLAEVGGLRLPSEFMGLSEAQVNELLCRANPGVWAEQRRGFTNAALHWEWYNLATSAARLAVVAPREHAKTECLTVNMTAWRSIFQPGTWTYVFANTKEQGVEIKDRIDEAVREDRPMLVENARTMTKSESRYWNYSRVTVAGAGKAVRGAHPDIIIGDDVMEEDTAMSRAHREKLARWWFGTIGGMAHPGTFRKVLGGKKVPMPATRVFLVGTPFHHEDLLMSMRTNPMYKYRRYAAEYRPGDLVDGMAVEVS